MAAPIRNISDAQPGQITSSKGNVLSKLAIRRLPIHGIRGTGRRSGKAN